MSAQYYIKTSFFVVVVVIAFHKMEPPIQKVSKVIIDTTIFSKLMFASGHKSVPSTET